MEALEQAADDWARSQKIERYIEAVAQMAAESNVQYTSRGELKKWTAWAQEKADWLNPLINWTDPILGSRKSEEDEPRFLTHILTHGGSFKYKRLTIVNKRKTYKLRLSRYLGDM